MKRVLASLAIFLVLFATILPSSTEAGGSWGHGGHGGSHHGGHGGFHHAGHGCCWGGWWWWPGAFIGGVALGAAALATAPFWAFAPPPVYYAPQVYAQPVYAQPAYVQPAYSQTIYARPAYTQPASYPVPPPGSAPPPNVPPPGSAPLENYQAPSASVAPRPAPRSAPVVRGEVVYDNGRYLLYGDGVRQPWQWVWVPSDAPAPPPPPR